MICVVCIAGTYHRVLCCLAQNTMNIILFDLSSRTGNLFRCPHVPTASNIKPLRHLYIPHYGMYRQYCNNTTPLPCANPHYNSYQTLSPGNTVFIFKLQSRNPLSGLCEVILQKMVSSWIVHL